MSVRFQNQTDGSWLSKCGRFKIVKSPMQGTTTKYMLIDNTTGRNLRCRTLADGVEQANDVLVEAAAEKEREDG